MKPLKDIYNDYFLIGNIYTPNMPNSKIGSFLSEQFNVITAENIMKPLLIQPQKDEFIFSQSDEMMKFAKENDLEVIGHTLCWHNQSLNWIDEENTTKEQALEILRTHIETMMGRYKGKIIAWDVLNEAFSDGCELDTHEWRLHLRDSKWLRMIGPDYVRYVFEIAHRIDPDAKLYYNDYNLNYSAKAEATYYMVKELRESGVPLHGIGMQGHYHTNTPIESVENSLNLFSKLEGIEVSITELDVTITGSEKTSVLSDEHGIIQGQVYAQLFQVYKKYHAIIKRITFWGIEDSTSWRSDRFPTLFNKDLTPKPAFFAVANPEKFLEEYKLKNKREPKMVEATYGTPVIGKKIDSLWNQSEKISINQQITAWEGATGEAQIMWNEAFLFILIDVKVSEVNNSAVEIYNKDSIEIILNQENNRELSYKTSDCKIIISCDNDRVVGNALIANEIQSETLITKDGYCVQAKIPFDKYNQNNVMIGLDFQINDVDRQGARQSIAKWNGFTDASVISAEDWGIVKLKNKT